MECVADPLDILRRSLRQCSLQTLQFSSVQLFVNQTITFCLTGASKRLARRGGSSGRLWETLGCFEKPWEVLGGTGELWEPLGMLWEGPGTRWEALGGTGQLWEALEGLGRSVGPLAQIP